MPSEYKTCFTCQHFSRVDAMTTKCEHIELCYLRDNPGVSAEALRWVKTNADASGSIADAVEDCPLHALADSLVVIQYREANGECEYCAWPAGRCHHPMRLEW